MILYAYQKKPLRLDMAEDAWDEEDKCTNEEKKLEAFLEGALLALT